MIQEHHHHQPHVTTAWVNLEILSALVLVAVAVCYAVAVVRVRATGSWPVWRSVLWFSGLGCLGVGLVGPFARVATMGFTEHMIVHLLIGMIGPLLLVLAAPITLALRVLPTSGARLLARGLRSMPVRVVSHPVSAAILNAGGLWLLYTTSLYHLMHGSIPIHVLVHLHVVLAGLVFTAAIVSPDPNPHRAGFLMRAVVMVVFIAAHSVLAKWLYAYPPAGVDPGDARVGAQLMYYGGDIVDVLLLVLLFAGWYGGNNRVRLLRPNAAPRTTSTSMQER